ncbi:MAG: DUF4347 domain-containing protein, partial [Hyphomicrobium sp.]|nr:DUF4347 domain-containing protein [Hyphomicrobium sp.]
MSAPAAAAAPANIVFIDSAVANHSSLLSEIDPNSEIVVISQGENGIEIMAAYLSGRTNVGSIHVLSHGQAGEVTIGSAALTAESAAGQYADELAVIGQALASNGDILLYGCDTASGEEGQALLDAVSNATGADVAASIDSTGADALGGDWELEAA